MLRPLDALGDNRMVQILCVARFTGTIEAKETAIVR